MRPSQNAALALLVVTACAGGEEETGGSIAGMGGSDSDVGFAATVEPLVNVACNCHQSEPLLAPFSLRAGEAYANLVGASSMQLPTMLLVSPGALNESYLWHKLNGTQAQVGGMGDIMPPTIPLSSDELLVFERWIAAGAPR